MFLYVRNAISCKGNNIVFKITESMANRQSLTDLQSIHSIGNPTKVLLNFTFPLITYSNHNLYILVMYNISIYHSFTILSQFCPM